VEVRCHLCQATNPPGAGWCNQCGVRFQPVAVGQPAGPPAAAASPAPPAGPAPSLGGPPVPAPPFQSPPPAAPGYDRPGGWEPLSPQLAGVWPRVGARLLDALLVLLLGLRVVRADLAPLATRDALVRSLIIDLIWIVPFGWLIVAVLLGRDRRHQGWHDRAAGTLVVRSRA
jgi:RDD family